MSTAVCPGEPAGPSFPCLSAALRAGLLLACLCLGLAGWLPMAQAAPSSVYRCQGAHGESVFTSHPEGYTHCHVVSVTPQKSISRYTGARPKAGASKASSAGGHHAGPVVLRGSVYRIVRADGSVEYTNVRPAHKRGHKVTRLFNYIDTCAACAIHSSINWKTVPLNLTAYKQAVRKAAKRSGVKPAFLRAIIHAESAYNPNAMSAAGAQGLMQLMPATASSMGVADAFDASDNIAGGARYLAKLLKEFHGNHKLAAAAYNAGPQAVQKYDGVPPYAETRVYVRRVSTLYQRYSKALGGPTHSG